MVDVVVVGHVGRDLVLEVDDVPGPGAGAPVRARQERAGGAVNQAVAARQLGWSAALVAAVGDDDPGTAALADARADDIDVTGVVRRPGVPSALFVDVVPRDGARRLLEHVPEALGLTAGDVSAAAHLLEHARAVIVQAQQPSDAVRETVRIAAGAGALVVLDGATDRATLDDLLGRADVVRADATEAEQLLGRSLDGTEDVVRAARNLVESGAGCAALAAADADVLAWPEGHVVLPHLGSAPVDATGAGDAFVVGLVSALLEGHDVEIAGWWGAAAAALTVQHAGGQPDLSARAVGELAARSRPNSQELPR